MFARSPRLPQHFIIDQPEFSRLNFSERADWENEIFENVRKLDLKSKFSDKMMFDADASTPIFAVGTIVGVHSNKLTAKLKPKVTGPFRVISKVGEVNYRLTPIGFTSRSHPVVHVSRIGLWFPSKAIKPGIKDLEGSTAPTGGVKSLPDDGTHHATIPENTEEIDTHDREDEYQVDGISSHGYNADGKLVFLTYYSIDELPSWQTADNFIDADGVINDVFREYCSDKNILGEVSYKK
jgi:hypothetical protein